MGILIILFIKRSILEKFEDEVVIDTDKEGKPILPRTRFNIWITAFKKNETFRDSLIACGVKSSSDAGFLGEALFKKCSEEIHHPIWLSIADLKTLVVPEAKDLSSKQQCVLKCLAEHFNKRISFPPPVENEKGSKCTQEDYAYDSVETPV